MLAIFLSLLVCPLLLRFGQCKLRHNPMQKFQNNKSERIRKGDDAVQAKILIAAEESAIAARAIRVGHSHLATLRRLM